MMQCSLISCCARSQSLQAAQVCLMPTKFRDQLAFLQSKKAHTVSLPKRFTKKFQCAIMFK